MEKLVQYFVDHKQLAHWFAGVGSAVAVTWSTSSDFRAYVENELHIAPHWIQAIAGLVPFVALIYTNFKRQGT